MDLGADADDCANRCVLNGTDDEVGRANLIGEFAHIVGAFGMSHHNAVGVGFAECRNVFGAEPLMNGAVALP